MSKANKIILDGQIIEVGGNSDVEIMYRDEQHLTVKHNTDTYVLGTMEKIIKPATPTFSKAGGTYDGSQSLTISCATSGANIQYKIGSGSWTTGTSVALNQDTAQESKEYVITARATKNGETSDEATATYYIKRKLATPTISVNGDDYDLSRTATISGGTTGATHQYKVGSGVWQQGSSVTLNATATVYAKDTLAQWVDSNEATKAITIGKTKCYIGQAASVTTEADVEALSHAYKQDTLVGSTKSIDFGTSTQYVWFVVPSGKTIAKVSSDGFAVPIGSATTIGKYKVYRTNNQINSAFNFKFE